MKTIRLGVVLFCVLLATRPTAAAEHYVAVDGKAEGAGSEAAPWDLASTLSGTRQVAPGDTIWVRAGIYKHPNRRPGGNGYSVKLVGAAGKPIHVRAVPGERVTVDGGLRVEDPSKFLWIWDLEIIVSEKDNFIWRGQTKDPVPETATVVVRPSKYDPNRANLAIINWAKSKTVDVDPSTFLKAGDAFRIQSALDFFAVPVVEGKYEGKPVTIPMPVEQRTGQGEFCAFVILRQPPLGKAGHDSVD